MARSMCSWERSVWGERGGRVKSIGKCRAYLNDDFPRQQLTAAT